MRVTVLGKYSPFAPAGGACVGYWLREGMQGGEKSEGGLPPVRGLLLDCGPGVLSRFQEFIGNLSTIDDVVLSHLHFDHTADFHVLRYATSPGEPRDELPSHITVYSPAEPSTEFSLLTYKDSVEAKAVAPGDELFINGLKVRFFKGEHPIPSCAVRIETPRAVFAYSGDSRPCDGLLEAASGADVFLCEATALEKDARYAARGHLTARQAADIAMQAGVKKLILTHVWPFYDERVLLEECRSVFPSAVVAEEGHTYQMG